MYKDGQLVVLSPSLNIIPLPFESSLSVSYTDASELAQAMQHLEHHLAHIINIWVTSKCFFAQWVFGLGLTLDFSQVCWSCGLSHWGWNNCTCGIDGMPGDGESGARGDDGAAVPGAQL